MAWSDRLIVPPGSKVDLSEHDPADTLGLDKDGAEAELAETKLRMADLHQMLWAENKRALLVVLQGMDTSGKDGVIRQVMGGVHPQGARVTSFKRPSPEEADYGFLWRIAKVVPPRGDIGIFNRSHYEDVLIARVDRLVPEEVWSGRYEQINAFEKLVHDSGTTVLKFFLHISKDEQRERLQARLDDPTKNWKFEPADLEVRKKWDQYQRAYEDALTRCSTAHAPWRIIPADRKWVRNIAVSRTILETLEGFRMEWPRPHLDVKKIRIE